MMANVAEIIIFILLGVTCIQEFSIDFSKHWNTGFFFFTLFFIILYRCVATFGLTYVINKLRKEPIPLNDQVLMALSGLRGKFSFKRKSHLLILQWSFSGGIAFSLTKLLTYDGRVEHIHHMLTTCVAIIMFTSFIQGQRWFPDSKSRKASWNIFFISQYPYKKSPLT